MKSSPRFTFAILGADLVSVFLAFNILALLRGIGNPLEPLILPLVIPAALQVMSLALIDGYSPRTDFLSIVYTSQHLIAMLAAIIGTLLFIFVLLPAGEMLQQSRIVATISFLLATPINLGVRRALALRRTNIHLNRTILFVGDLNSAATFQEECNRAGFKRPIVNVSAHPVQGRDDLGAMVNHIEAGRMQVEAIVLRESTVDLPAGIPDRLVRLHFEGVPTYTLELFHERIWSKIPLYRINHAWLFQGGFHLSREPLFERVKRMSDILLALFVLLLSAPFLVLAAIAILLDSGGPVFFRQTRIGRYRAPFSLYKLRTMHSSSEGAHYTAKGDKRITRIGTILRAFRLDELPQLWNVLKGDMSMIGPRAEWDVLVRGYEREIPCYHFRHLVRPGITGWAQINYPYGAGIDDTLRKLEYDLFYIRHYSFQIDASIVLKTVHVMLFDKGSR
jgi:exopolysaccharide biosynthesis polyprenyl glycosylphosphotransferase